MGRNKALNGKEPIIRAAIELIDRDGEEALSIRNLSRELNVAPMTIYNYLKNIDDVKREVLIQHYNSLSGEILARLTAGDYKDLSREEQYLSIYLGIYYNYIAEHSELIRFVMGTGHSKFHDDAELRHFMRPLEIFYNHISDKERRLAYHMCEDLVYMMLCNQVEKRDVISLEEMQYRARFIIKRIL